MNAQSVVTVSLLAVTVEIRYALNALLLVNGAITIIAGIASRNVTSVGMKAASIVTLLALIVVVIITALIVQATA